MWPPSPTIRGMAAGHKPLLRFAVSHPSRARMHSALCWWAVSKTVAARSSCVPLCAYLIAVYSASAFFGCDRSLSGSHGLPVPAAFPARVMHRRCRDAANAPTAQAKAAQRSAKQKGFPALPERDDTADPLWRGEPEPQQQVPASARGAHRRVPLPLPAYRPPPIRHSHTHPSSVIPFVTTTRERQGTEAGAEARAGGEGRRPRATPDAWRPFLCGRRAQASNRRDSSFSMSRSRCGRQSDSRECDQQPADGDSRGNSHFPRPLWGWGC